jgi:hypothetical protein
MPPKYALHKLKNKYDKNKIDYSGGKNKYGSFY